MIEVEICCNSRASAEAAKAGGATRIELCRDLECGGLTPAIGDVEYCVHVLRLRTHVLVRPRAGDFCYSQAEMAEILAAIRRCKAVGAHAVVVGFLSADGRIDEELTRRAVAEAEGMEVTFHRAFDEARQDPLEALAAIAACGCTRLLTSGQRPSAPEGAATLRRLVAARSGVAILAGGGVTADNVRQLVAQAAVGEVHASCKTTLPDGTAMTDAAHVRRLLDNVSEIK